VLDQVINLSGSVRADSVEQEGGRILLLARGGTARVEGSLSARGTAEGSRGGSIEVLGDRVTLASTARIDDDRYAPAPVPVYDSRRRGGERLYEANVTSERAVLATSGQRCWVEREQVPQDRGGANVPVAIAGAIIGGILGHQVGGGRGQDIATAGGAVAGAAVGANVGRKGQTTTQDVQRCEDVPGGARPAYWDVTYDFRGQDHRVQMAAPPGRTITVNEQGEPRQ
jgi:uncharacterized protein YcfJ